MVGFDSFVGKLLTTRPPRLPLSSSPPPCSGILKLSEIRCSSQQGTNRQWEHHPSKVLNPEKYHFGASQIRFLRFIINSNVIGMQSDRISTIEDLATPKSMQHVHMLLGFTNFYRQFIGKYPKVTAQISDCLHKSTRTWEWTRKATHPFRELKTSYSEAPINQHFDPVLPAILQMDQSCFAITGILNLYDHFCILGQVNFRWGSWSGDEQNRDTYHLVLFTIVETFRQWQHYLE